MPIAALIIDHAYSDAKVIIIAIPRVRHYGKIFASVLFLPADTVDLDRNISQCCHPSHGEGSEPPSDKLGGEICISSDMLVCLSLYIYTSYYNSYVMKVIIPAKFPRDTISSLCYFFLYFLETSLCSVL